MYKRQIDYILKCRAQGWTWEQVYKSEYGRAHKLYPKRAKELLNIAA